MAQNRDEQEIVEGVGNITINAAARPEPERRHRAELLGYYRNITLDPDTAHRKLILSEDGRKATRVTEPQHHPDDSNRFTKNHQVLSKETLSLTEHQYWEVDLGGLGAVVAVAYGNISRTPEGGFGQTGESWALWCPNPHTFLHNNERTPLPSTIGVYWEKKRKIKEQEKVKGILSFYRVSGETLHFLHKEEITFSTKRPLHAGVRLDLINASAEFIHRR